MWYKLIGIRGSFEATMCPYTEHKNKLYLTSLPSSSVAHRHTSKEAQFKPIQPGSLHAEALISLLTRIVIALVTNLHTCYSMQQDV